jgi:hypothetical protein
MLISSDNGAFIEAVRLMRDVRTAREALDRSSAEAAVLKGQLRAANERTALLSDAYSSSVNKLANHARLFTFE